MKLSKIQGKQDYKYSNKKLILICGVIGVLIFILIYGISTLDVTYDDWIFNGYVEKDIELHYAGWLAFRNSQWSWPLGLIKNLQYPYGIVVSYTDSIPIVSIIMKLVSNILPQTFQFFGWYILICFVLQGVSICYVNKFIY